MSNYNVSRPNYGGINWRPVALPIVILCCGFWAVTQVAAHGMGYARELGDPWGRIGPLAVYAPWAWVGWVLKYLGTPVAPALWKALGVGGLFVLTAIAFFIASMVASQRRSAMAAGLHGSARFADHTDLQASGLLTSKDGVYVGAWRNAATGYVHYLRDGGPAHVLGFAPTRSGKGVGLVIPTLLAWPESVVVFDIKGENFALTSGYRKTLGAVFCFCPTQENSARYNPLAAIRIGTTRETSDVQIVANLLVDRGDGSGESSYWDEAAQGFLTGIITHVCYVARNQGKVPTLERVINLIADPSRTLEDTLKEVLATEHSTTPWTDDDGNKTKCHPVVGRQVRIMAEKADKDRSGVYSTVMAALRIYDDQLLSKNLSASDFTVEDLVNSTVSLYLVVPPSDRERLRPIIRLIFGQIIGQLTESMSFSGGKQVTRSNRLLLMIDEFPSLGKLPILESALAYMAGYGLKAYLIAQDLTQIKSAYGEHEAVVANCHIRVAFAPNTVDTAELLSTMSGTTTVAHESATYSGSRLSTVSSSRSTTVQFVERPLMTVDEIMRLRLTRNGIPGEQIVFIAGQRPIMCQNILYYSDPTFSTRSKKQPSATKYIPAKTPTKTP